MMPKDTQILACFHPGEESLVLPVLEQAKAAGWSNINIIDAKTEQPAVLDRIQKCGMVLIFLSKAYARDERLMLERFAYASTVVRKPYIPVWLESLADIRQFYKKDESDQQLLSALEMLTAKYPGTTADKLIIALEQFSADNIPYIPSAPQICEKPSEAYEGNEPFIFISYAHDDANRVYPIIKELYESGWDLWYDEGIKTTERYLPVISYHVKRCSVVVLMLTNRCLNRPFVMNYELEYARQLGIPVIPVLLEKLTPQPWSKENVDQLMKTAIAPDKLLNRISAAGLVNRGKRKAVPPAIKQNVVYDIVLPPELPGFNYTVQNDEITITRYIGNDKDVVIPGTVTSPDGSVTFKVTTIGIFAFTGGGFLIRLSMPKDFIKNKNTLRNCKLLTSVTIPNTVRSINGAAFSGCKSLKNISIPNSVTNIDMMAFYGCKSLKNISIPDSVTKIDSMAFSGCKSLDNIIIPNSINIIENMVFFSCHSLKNITIPESVTSIGETAFGQCHSLRNITIPESVTSIGMGAFIGCKSLTSITIPNSVIKIDNIAFQVCKSLKSVIITNNNSEIGDKVFLRCKSLKTVILPDTIKKMGKHVFSSCPQLDAIFNADKTTIYRGPANWKSFKPYSIPDGVTKINSGAFSGPSLFRKITSRIYNYRPPRKIIIPESITEINDEAFADYRELKIITIPNSVTCIGESAFKNCISLKNIKIPDNVKTIRDNAFRNCRHLKSIVIPNNVTAVGNYVFTNCKSLKNIAILGNITNIGNFAFWNCIALRNINIPESVTAIDTCAFYNCRSLRNILIPGKVRNIGGGSFKRCRSLLSVTIPESVIEIGDEAFLGCKSLKNFKIPKTVQNVGENVYGKIKFSLSNMIEGYITPGVFQPLKNFKDDIKTALEGVIPEDDDEEETGQFAIPICPETSRAKVCCALFDIEQVSTLLTEIYWEGFNIFLNKSTDEQEIRESKCVLAFISKQTPESPEAMDILKKAVKYDVSRIIQVFIGDCMDLPEEIKPMLHDRQAIIQQNLSPKEFTGKIRDSLRQFGCDLGHPRGFDVTKTGDSVEIVKFNPTGFNQVIIPKTFFTPPLPLTSIGATAFIGCEYLTSVIIPEGVTSINNGDVGAFNQTGAFKGCKSLSNVIIPDSVTHIGDCAFYECESLTNIRIPDSVTYIGKGAFFRCRALTDITIPDNITSLNDLAFGNCDSLTYIDIPKNVISIGNMVFYECKSLRTVVIPDSVTSFGKKSVFDKCDALTIYTPNGSKARQYAEENNINCKPLVDTDVNQNDAEALYNLGINYEEGEGVPKDMEKAYYWYAKAAELGNAEAQNRLGMCYEEGEGVPKDLKKANYWYAKAAGQGYAIAQCNLGYNYDMGIGVPQDLVKANYWYAKAAEQGYAMAQCNLGYNYEMGIGVPRDFEKANYWYAKAAEQGYAMAQCNLGINYGRGRGVQKDFDKANYWFTKAAEQGHAMAQTRLGISYADGRGVEQDFEKANYWFNIAAEQGDALAQNSLGLSYANGNGVPKDFKKAKYYFTEAAEQGNAMAQCNLAFIYLNGDGVPKDLNAARHWFTKAAEQGNKKAKEELAKLDKV